ncbi:MAG: iron-sulfur cluster assembly accessory protein [Candidatus Heimdallarchaeota archaeon]|nr:iron-sulfur cluster assembly accessory protein [Candidatus Heimdallarchaeota archaeon]MDH5646085.1 iron-sulfur cluster assembly accessory protein [Candidatus Heimdallarchaeota archaeon]
MVELSLNFTQPDESFYLTESAAKRINELISLEGRDGQAIHIKVIPGGCAGFSYQFGWISTDADGFKAEKDGAMVIIGHTDMRLITGSTLDFIVSLQGSKFEINNPNATSSCGCGKSFA